LFFLRARHFDSRHPDLRAGQSGCHACASSPEFAPAQQRRIGAGHRSCRKIPNRGAPGARRWSGDSHCVVAFAAGRRRDACPKEPAPGPGVIVVGLHSGSFCFCSVGGGGVLWRTSRSELRRTRALHGVFGLGGSLVLFSSGCSTLLWSHTYAATGSPHSFPGAACWLET
jgi:hypothetical protein